MKYISNKSVSSVSCQHELFTIETVLEITTADFANSVDILKKSEYNSLEKWRL